MMIDHLISLPLSWTSVFSVLIADIYSLYILLYFLEIVFYQLSFLMFHWIGVFYLFKPFINLFQLDWCFLMFHWIGVFCSIDFVIFRFLIVPIGLVFFSV